MLTTNSAALAAATVRTNRPGRRRLPAALFVVSGLILGLGAVQNGIGSGDRSDPLPSPAYMASLSIGRQPTVEIVELWQERVESQPTNVSAIAELTNATIQLAGETGDLSLYAEAEAAARRAVELDPTSEAAALALAAALSGQHDFAAAADIARGVLDRTPDSVGARLALGDASLELGDYAGASVAYNRVAFDLGGEPAVLSRFARLRALTGDIDQARADARAALVAAGDEDLDSHTAAFYWFQLATYEYQTGRYDRAHELLESALSIQPSHPGSNELLGNVLIARGEVAAATELFEELVAGTPAADLHGRLADLYRVAGRDRDADRQVALGLALAAEQADAFPAERRHLIGFYADREPGRAVELARQDLEIRRDVAAYGWLGWSLLQDGQVDAAAQFVDEMLAQGTEDAWLLYQAGSILAADGQTAQAVELLDRAIELNPRFDLVHADRAAELLARLPPG